MTVVDAVFQPRTGNCRCTEHRKSIELQPNDYDPPHFSLIENTTAGDSNPGYRWIESRWRSGGREKKCGEEIDRREILAAVDRFELCSSNRLIERILL